MQLEPGDTAFDYMVDLNGDWVAWSSQVPSWKFPTGPKAPSFPSLIVPTLDSVRYTALFHLVRLADKASMT